MTAQRHVQAELLLPYQLREALERRSVVYIPVGSYEFHGEHLPIGLDSLNAHGVCLAAATRNGGVVLPPLFYGTGGGHSEYPWTIMVADPGHIRALLATTLERLQDFGVGLAVLFSGHFAPEQLEMLDDVAEAWRNAGNSMVVITQAVNMPLEDAPEPDHAGVFETTLLSCFWPELIHLDRLPSIEESPSIDPNGDLAGIQRHNPNHPLWGVMGADPRTLDASRNLQLLDKLVSRLVADVVRALPAIE